MATKITIEELMAKLPDEYNPVIAKYGPALLEMTTGELWSWIELMARGDTDRAYKTLLSRMTNAALITEMDKINAEWETTNEANAQRLKLQRNASLAILRVTLQMVMALVDL